jgi:hypothetical protein
MTLTPIHRRSILNPSSWAFPTKALKAISRPDTWNFASECRPVGAAEISYAEIALLFCEKLLPLSGLYSVLEGRLESHI